MVMDNLAKKVEVVGGRGGGGAKPHSLKFISYSVPLKC